MKLLLLTISQYSKKFIGEISIAIQAFVLSLLLMLVLTPLISSLIQSSLLFKHFPHNSLYFTPFTSIQSKLASKKISYDDKEQILNNIDDRMLSYEKVQHVGKNCSSLIEMPNKDIATVFYYNSALLQGFPPIRQNQSITVPLLALQQENSFIETQDKLSLFDKTSISNAPFEVQNCFNLSKIQIVDLRSSGSDPKISDIFPSKEEKILFITEYKYINKSDGFLNLNGSRLVYTSCVDKRSLNSMVEVLNSEMADVGRFFTMRDLFFAQLKYDIEVQRYNAVMCISLFLLTIFGLGGYISLTGINNLKMFSIYFICGMSITTKNKLTLIGNGILLIMPIIFASFIYLFMLTSQITAAHILAVFIVIIIFSLTFIFCNLAIHFYSNKKIANAYKGD